MATDTPADSGTAAPEEDHAAYLAGLNKLLSGEEPAEEKPKDETLPAEDADKQADEGEEKADAEEAEEAEAAEEEETAEDDKDEEESEVDEEALRKLQKEKRSFERHKAEVLAHERQVKEREQRVTTTEREIAEFIQRLRVDPFTALVQAKILDEADISYAARQLFLMTPEALKDPRAKAEAEARRRERERDFAAMQANARVERLEREREQEKAKQAEERQLNDYVARIKATTTVFKAKTPLLEKAMTADSAATERELYQLAYELSQAQGGHFVEPGKVVLAWEKQQRERLARLGFAQEKATPAAQSKAKTPTAAKQQGQSQKGKEGAPAAAEPADPDIAKSDDEYMAELRRRLGKS